MIFLEDAIDGYVNHLKALQRSYIFCHGEGRHLHFFQRFCKERKILTLEQIKLEHVAHYARYLQGYCAATTCYLRVGAVRRWLKWATHRGLLMENPTAGWLGRHPPVPFRHVPTEAQMKAILVAPEETTPSGLRDRVLLEFLYGTGLRLHECAQVTLEDLDLQDRACRVAHGKGGTTRRQPLGPNLTIPISPEHPAPTQHQRSDEGSFP